jgi:Common central domain of tyrosinase/Polyphenol oxidase middle domain
MGSVPVAALDPIFYAHHTNIDRLYDCWLNVDAPNRLPNDPAQLGTMFTFVDSDGSTSQRRVGDMLTTTQLGYSYGSGGGCPAALRTTAMMIAGGAAETLAVAGPSRISGASTTVPLAVREALAPRLGAAAPGRLELGVPHQGYRYRGGRGLSGSIEA